MAVKKSSAESEERKPARPRRANAEAPAEEIAEPVAAAPARPAKRPKLPELVAAAVTPVAASLKKARKLAKDAEGRLKKELQRFKAASKKAAERPGYHVVLEDREKIKKAHFMLDGLRVFLKETEKKNHKIAAPPPIYHQQIEESIADVKAARRRLKDIGRLTLSDEAEAEADDAPDAPEAAPPPARRSPSASKTRHLP